jgi:hypothetical protein
MTKEEQIRADLKRFQETGELPEAWAVDEDVAECMGHDSEMFPEESNGYPRTIYCDGACRWPARRITDEEFDRRVAEINRELEAIESGCVEPPPLGWLNEIGKPR